MRRIVNKVVTAIITVTRVVSQASTNLGISSLSTASGVFRFSTDNNSNVNNFVITFIPNSR